MSKPSSHLNIEYFIKISPLYFTPDNITSITPPLVNILYKHHEVYCFFNRNNILSLFISSGCPTKTNSRGNHQLETRVLSCKANQLYRKFFEANYEYTYGDGLVGKARLCGNPADQSGMRCDKVSPFIYTRSFHHY
jgi:hypothetical protein